MEENHDDGQELGGDGDDDDDKDDEEVEAICSDLFSDSAAGQQSNKDRKRARTILFNGLDDVDPVKVEAKMAGFDFLASATKSAFKDDVGTLFCEAMFWGQGLAGMTPLEAVNANRPKELAALLALEPRWVDWRAPPSSAEEEVVVVGQGSTLTLLQRAFLLDHFKCVQVLVEAGAAGAVDILNKTESLLRLDTMPYLLSGCSRADLRTMERRRLSELKPPIGRLFLKTMREVVYFRPALTDDEPRIAQELAYRETLMKWIEASGADDFRDCSGSSLQDDAEKMCDWTLFHALQRRAVFTVMNVHRWTRSVNPVFCRIHRDVLVHKIVPLLFRPAYCHRCRRGIKAPEFCGGCRTVPIPCQLCRKDYLRDYATTPEYVDCSRCKQPICQDCSRCCFAHSCNAPLCVLCAPVPGPCDECVARELHANNWQWPLQHPSSSSSDDGSDSDDQSPSHWGSGEVDMEAPSEPSSPGPQFTPVDAAVDDAGDKQTGTAFPDDDW